MNRKWLQAGGGLLMVLVAAGIYLFGGVEPAPPSTAVLAIVGLLLLATARLGQSKQAG